MGKVGLAIEPNPEPDVEPAKPLPTGMWRPAHGGLLMPPIRKGEVRNPTGKGGQYREVLKLARDNSRHAVERLIELMESHDPRISLVACERVIERAFGKPKDIAPDEMRDQTRKVDIKAILKQATDEELRALKALFGRIRILQEEADKEAAANAEAETEQAEAPVIDGEPEPIA
jgi:hypothetical protein